jgi:hypothetical protein
MQGGGQFYGGDPAGRVYAKQHIQEEIDSAQKARLARRHRARHGSGHFSWLRLGSHGKHTADG